MPGKNDAFVPYLIRVHLLSQACIQLDPVAYVLYIVPIF